MKFYIVGVLNVTPDSFYDGGKYTCVDAALNQAEKMIEEGADILDIGGESTRPSSERVSVEEEIRRVIPVIQKLKQKTSIPISIDTTKSPVAKAACDAGAAIVNDISGFKMDPDMTKTIAAYQTKVVIGHIQGTPKTMQQNPHYDDVVQEISDYFKERIEAAKRHDISKQRIILDPGIGFGKTVEHNLEILRRLNEFLVHGCPLMIGTSRKSFIGQLTNAKDPNDRLGGSIATAVTAYMNGATYIRVHDVKETKQALSVVSQIISERTVGSSRRPCDSTAKGRSHSPLKLG